MDKYIISIIFKGTLMFHVLLSYGINFPKKQTQIMTLKERSAAENLSCMYTTFEIQYLALTFSCYG